MKQATLGDGQDEESPTPGHRNYLVYASEGGIYSPRYYGCGTLWIPWERRADLDAMVAELRDRHRYPDAIKWTHVSRYSRAFYLGLVKGFFARDWLTFHCLIAPKDFRGSHLPADFDEARRKLLALLLTTKVVASCQRSPDHAYHLRLDPLPSRSLQAAAPASPPAGSDREHALALQPLKTLVLCRATSTVGIQVADLMLGATISAWQDDTSAGPKLDVRACLAEHLGWPDLRAETDAQEAKFNVCYCRAPAPAPGEAPMRPVKLKLSPPPAGASLPSSSSG